MSTRKRWLAARRWLRKARRRVWAATVGKRRTKPGTPERRRAVEILVRREAVRDRLAKRERKLRKKLQEEQDALGIDNDGDGLVMIDGKPVATPIAKDIFEAQRRGLLPQSGVVISAYRTPAYSISLCYGICGAPSCPGRCAGAASRHAKLGREGAVDVRLGLQDQFESAMRQIASALHNSIGASDPNHMSYYGN
jgi:hypothetical protein